MRIYYLLIFICFFSVHARSQTDAKVDAVYTLGKIPAPLGVYRHVVKARIINTGTNVLTALPVYLNVSSANSFRDTQTVDIAVGDTAIVSFDAFSPWNPGTNLVTVTVPDDANNANNSNAYTQLVNANTFSYADASPPVSTASAGFGNNSGILLTKYTITGSGLVTQVRAHISAPVANIGNTVYGIVMQFGSIVAQSAPHVITAADLDSYINLDIVDPQNIEGEIMTGLLQTANASAAYYPLSYQNEGTKTRPDAYYASFADGSGLTAITSIGRFMIEAIVSTGTETPFNVPPQPNYPIAAWDFTGVNSPASTPATIVDTILALTPVLTRGPAAPASAGTNSFFTTGFSNDGIAETNNDYFQFSLTPKAGDTLSLREIDGYAGNSADTLVADVNSQFAYSIDGINYTLIGSPSTDNTNGFAFYVGNISDLQNITGSTTVRFRYYASGQTANDAWGFLSSLPGRLGLSVSGRSVSSNTVTTSPVIPTGADYTLSDCNTTAAGSIAFTSTGTFASNNKYFVELGRLYQPHPNTYLFLSPVTVGTLTSSANSGVINFTVPAGIISGYYALRITSTSPHVVGTYSQGFLITAPYCHSETTDRFRTKTSGDWTDLSIWESSSNGTDWIQATLIPDDFAYQVEIRLGDTVSVTSYVSTNRTTIRGVLKLLNGNGDFGSLSIFSHTLSSPFLKIDTSGVWQIVSQDGSLNEILSSSGFISVAGKITIGDGSTLMVNGFDDIAASDNIFWSNGSVFEWNCNSSSAPQFDTTYFPGTFATPTFRLTAIPPGNLGGSINATVNGLLEVNTPVTFAGTGTKTFRDGIKGSSTLTQVAGSGQLFTDAVFEDIAATSTTVATKKGILGGTVNLNLSSDGLTLLQGATVPDTSKVTVAGRCFSSGSFAIQPAAVLTINTDTLFLDNADLTNEGMVNGLGDIKFRGDIASALTSPGTMTAPIFLSNKEVYLGGNSNVSAVNLAGISHITLANFNLDMAPSALQADSVNFIITNDTGRLNRYVAVTPVLYPVGTGISSYTPVSIQNTGNATFIKVRVADGIQTSIPITNENVNRTWLIGDTSQAGCNLSFIIRWNAADEQTDFDRSNCYISHLSECNQPLNCTDGFFDATIPAAAMQVGTMSYSMQRSGIDNFNSPAFIVSSKPFIYTFTGNGDWLDPLNWTPAIVAPTVIPPGIEVRIDPSGQCLRNGNILVKQGGKLLVQPGKNLTVNGNITVE